MLPACPSGSVATNLTILGFLWALNVASSAGTSHARLRFSTVTTLVFTSTTERLREVLLSYR